MTTSYTRFGEVEFKILAIGGGPEIVPDWAQESFTASHHIHGSNSNIRFYMGLGPSRVTYTIESPSIEDYRKLRASLQNTDELWLRAGLASESGEEVMVFDTVYMKLADTTLVDLSQPVIIRQGRVRATAVFERESNV